MINTITIILAVIISYLAIGFTIAIVKLPPEDKKGCSGCVSVLLGTTAWPIVLGLVLIAKIFIWKNKNKEVKR